MVQGLNPAHKSTCMTTGHSSYCHLHLSTAQLLNDALVKVVLLKGCKRVKEEEGNEAAPPLVLTSPAGPAVLLPAPFPSFKAKCPGWYLCIARVGKKVFACIQGSILYCIVLTVLLTHREVNSPEFSGSGLQARVPKMKGTTQLTSFCLGNQD